MSQVATSEEDPIDAQIQKNIARWQDPDNPLAPLTEEQLNVFYETRDKVRELYGSDIKKLDEAPEEQDAPSNDTIPVIYSIRSFVQWMSLVEDDVEKENLHELHEYYQLLLYHKNQCFNLFECSGTAMKSLQELKEKYQDVTTKTNYLHDLSEQLMMHQRLLKEKKSSLNEKLKHFALFSKTQENIDRLSQQINTKEFAEVLDGIEEAMEYLNAHMHFKESRIHKMKYESLLLAGLNKVYNYVNNIITETHKQVVDPDFKSHVSTTDLNIDSSFSLYYGKFQSASTKVKAIISHLEGKEEKNEHYKNVISDCKKTYLTQRLPLLGMAVSKALTELKEKHKTDHSILFRASCLFTMKVCQDEARCYSYFFSKPSEQLNDYLATLCQYLYDILRPSLITINHVEVLSELCGILKKEMLNEKIIGNDHLLRYVETIKQLLQDVEERLVFRTNVFIQHDLKGYKPSPGDLAYPEKLEQMENIAIELRDIRADSRSSIVSLESQEVAHINTTQMAHFRSYTGNSPADLHGMWYPTVKRTLVCLSRLYFCLDRDTFQGLAQEALIICIKTVHEAADLISTRKTPVDGKLFQIKHLLIIREQIAPFQVDFTVTEMTLDFSTVQKAAMDLIHKRNNLFTFGSNNALLEFLLEGTPKVKEYLVDSRKEIDKELKQSCEAFISRVTHALISNILQFIEKSEHILKIAKVQGGTDLTVAEQEFAKPALVAQILKEAQKNMKTKIPEIQRLMQLYLANRETEFILFRPIKNNLINAFMQVDQILLTGGYTAEDQLLIACPSPEQINILVCSVSLSGEQDVIPSSA